MKTITLSLAVALLASTAGAANAAASLDLSRYSVAKATSLGIAEASGVTYNWDRNSLLVVGDEGTADEFNLDGSHKAGVLDYLGVSRFNDVEFISYLGGNKYVTGYERQMTMATVTATEDSFDFGGGVHRWFFGANETLYSFSNNVNVGNIGLEGVSYDPITGGFFAVKENSPQGVYFLNSASAAPNSHVNAFDPALLGLVTLSDIQVLSTAFAGEAFGENLLILSQSSQKLLEVTRTGEILSTFDLSGIMSDAGFNINTIEGVTIDFDGNIYLVAEQGGNSAATGYSSALIVLSAPALPGAVPEPATWAMMIGGFAMVGAGMRRRKATVRFA